MEVSTVGIAWDVSKKSKRLLNIIDLMPVIGYSFYRQGLDRGSGPTLRITASVPETEFSIGPYIRWLSYQASGDSTRRISYGLRIEAGFSEYMTFYLIGGMDYGQTLSGRLNRERNFGGGLRLGMPLTFLK